MTLLRALPNLSASNTELVSPWDFEAEIPEEVRGKGGKKARSEWINSRDTEHCCYSGFEGLNENQRITKGASADEGNPAYRMLAVVADYDAKVTDPEIQAALTRCQFVPAYVERTLSGNARIVWLLEAPVLLPNSNFASHFLSYVCDKMRLELVLPALDRKAFENPGQYYTNSCDWVVVSEKSVLSQEIVLGWFVEASDRFLWKQHADLGPEIPLSDVAEELRQRFPRFSEWTGPFEDGARGPTFWIEGSTSPQSAIVRPNGIQTFASHATRAFYRWQDLLGADFVANYKTIRLGKAVEGIYFDRKQFWMKLPSGEWRDICNGDMRNYLNAKVGLSAAKRKGAASEVDHAIAHIQLNAWVDGAAPCVFRPAGMLRLSGARILNIHTGSCLQPAPGAAVWGPSGQFPWISSFLDGFFATREQLDWFLAWLSLYYTGCLNRDLELGQFLFMGGPAGCGKSLLNREIVGELVGGYVDAVRYIMGEDNFGGQNFHVAHWCVDDATVNSSVKSVGEFSERVKKMAADSVFEYHQKFCVPASVVWNGRLFTTHNMDSHSTRIIPDLDISIRDKISLLRADEHRAGWEFPARREIRATLARELPHFAAYLKGYAVPEALMTTRFGLRSYHDPLLASLANSSSRSTGFAEILEDFCERYFGANDTKTEWVGTSFQLHRELNQGGADAAMRGITVDSVGRMLGMLQAKGYPIDSAEAEDSERSLRIWKIRKREHPLLPAKTPAPTPAVLPAGESKFSK